MHKLTGLKKKLVYIYLRIETFFKKEIRTSDHPFSHIQKHKDNWHCNKIKPNTQGEIHCQHIKSLHSLKK